MLLVSRCISIPQESFGTSYIIFFILFLSYRHDSYMLNGRLAYGDVPPSSNNIAIRKRKRDICNVIHNMTWVVESFVILSGCTSQLLSMKIDPYLVQSIQDTNGLLCARIIVPFTYLYSENSIKQIILEHGWIRATKAALSFDRFLEILPYPKNNTAAILPFEIHPQSSADSENVFNSRVRLHTISNPALNDIISSRSAISVARSGKDAETRRYGPHRHEHLDSKNLPNVVLEENSSEF